MFVDIPKGNNTGSCRNLAEYLNKEKIQENRFFSDDASDIHVEDVIRQIDNNNRQGLGKDEAKYFLVDICPSDLELKHLIGRDVSNFDELTITEKNKLFDDLKNYTTGVMDDYANNFKRENIKGGDDILYFAKIEVNRIYKYNDEAVKSGKKRIGEPKEGLNVHVQVIVSRKSKNGKVKLSPAYGKSRGNDWHLAGRGRVRRGFNHEAFKEQAGRRFEKQFKYKLNKNEKYTKSEKSVKEEILSRVTNKNLREILEKHKFTNQSQVAFLMKDRGYTCSFYRGNYIFKRGTEKFIISSKALSKFTTPYLSDMDMRNISDRFNGFKFDERKDNYKDENIKIEKVSFLKKDGTKFEYFVLHDKITKSSIPVSRIRNYAYDNKINIYSKEKAKEIDNKDLRDTLSNSKIRTYRQFEASMRSKGYKIDIDAKKGFRFTKNNNEFYMKGSAIRASFMGYGKHTSSEFQGKSYTRYSHSGNIEKMVTGNIQGNIKSKAEKFIFKDQFAEERKIIHKGQQAGHLAVKAAKIISNPTIAPIEITKSLLKATLKLGIKITNNG